MTHKFALTVQCASKPGVVAAIATYLADNDCNITDSAQFDDLEIGSFFTRMSFSCGKDQSLEALANGFEPIGRAKQMNFGFHDETKRMKVAIFVSRFGHCLNDILYRWRIGALPIDIVAVISNHEDYRDLVEGRGLPFHHIPVTPQTKAAAEAQQLNLIRETGAELVVLARYMQVLSDDMCKTMSGKIINIHHSFLPSFKGAAPYKQAHERGVKLIGATAHYVTADLDEGPIIEQDIVRVTHAQSASDFVALGRDVEAQVLARAIHAHIHHRTFISGNKTIVFPASPDSYASERMG